MKTTSRQVNPFDTIQYWCRTWKPDGALVGTTRADYARWRRAFARHYRRCLGPWPRRVPPRVAVIERVDKGDYVREKVYFDSTDGVTVPAYVLTPKGLAAGERRPGLLAAHGHGNGKDDICGVTREKGGDIRYVEELHYEYAVEAVRRGYVVVAPDWCPFGERRAPKEWARAGRDPCNVTGMAFQYFGRPLLTQNIWDGLRAVDVLADRPQVDRRRLGVIGLSLGGTLTTHLIANDPRLQAAVVSGYVSTVRGDALNMRGKANTCGAQHVPGLLRHGDIPEVLGLAAPKPILFEIGRKETCFHFPDMMVAYRRVRRLYRAAGCAERVAADIHPHDHRWNGVKAWAWLARYV